MRTSKPISTISYNSPDFLKARLYELVQNKIISFWVFIYHKKEEDEKKDHIHLFLIPSKMIQTDDLKDEFKEIDLMHPDKPLGCIGFNSSKFEHWYFYGKHDKLYLRYAKNQSRKYHYNQDEFVSSDPLEFESMVNECHLPDLIPNGEMMVCIEKGMSWHQFVQSHTIPIQLFNQYRNAFITYQEALGVLPDEDYLKFRSVLEDLAKAPKTDRNNKKNHEMEN